MGFCEPGSRNSSAGWFWVRLQSDGGGIAESHSLTCLWLSWSFWKSWGKNAPHVSLSLRSPSGVFFSMARPFSGWLGPSKVVSHKGEPGGSCIAFSDRASEVTQRHLRCVPLEEAATLAPIERLYDSILSPLLLVFPYLLYGFLMIALGLIIRVYLSLVTFYLQIRQHFRSSLRASQLTTSTPRSLSPSFVLLFS